MLLPVKRLEQAKLRLASILSGDERAELVRAMLSDVAAAVVEAGLEPCVLSPDPAVLEYAESIRARPLPQPSRARSLNGALIWALAEASQAALIILPDTPLVTADEVRCMAGRCPVGRAELRSELDEVVVATDRRGTGTNGLWLRPATVIPPGFGRNSQRRHLQAAIDRGLEPRLQGLSGLSLDIDMPEDLRDFLDTQDGAPQTRSLLLGLRVADRLTGIAAS